MPAWVRNLVVLVALAGWAVTIGAYIWQGQLPGAPILGVPGAIWLAMSPTLPNINIPRRRGARTNEGDE